MTRTIILFLAFAAAFLFGDAPGRHPAYLHARTDLRRAERLMDVQRDISMQKNLEKISQTYKVLIDRVEGDNWIGRTEFDSPEVDNEVLISASNDNYLRIGDFYNVKITDAMEYDLFGEVLYVKPHLGWRL